MRSNGNDGERLAARFTSEGAMSDTDARDDVDDSRIDAMVARARASAALPETRLRMMKVIDDSSHLGVIPTDTSTYDLAGADLYLEARLTWRLDRLLYADDEPTLERTRLERRETSFKRFARRPRERNASLRQLEDIARRRVLQ